MNPPTARAVSFAQHLAKEFAVILEGDLVGVYLHGSGATACFNPDRSDIDLLVVVESARFGRHRWRVEPSLSWLSCFRRLQVRWTEIRAGGLRSRCWPARSSV